MKTNQKIVHLHLKSPLDGESDMYFGSIKAIYDRLSEDVVGIKYKSLTNALRGKDNYENSRCAIHIGLLQTKRQSKSHESFE